MIPTEIRAVFGGSVGLYKKCSAGAVREVSRRGTGWTEVHQKRWKGFEAGDEHVQRPRGCRVGSGLDSAREGRAAFTHWVALTSTEMGTLGPFRMSALIHTGLWTRPSAVSCCRRSREGPTALMFLKSSLMPVGRKWA